MIDIIGIEATEIQLLRYVAHFDFGIILAYSGKSAVVHVDYSTCQHHLHDFPIHIVLQA